jgi:hypothetical protein
MIAVPRAMKMTAGGHACQIIFHGRMRAHRGDSVIVSSKIEEELQKPTQIQPAGVFIPSDILYYNYISSSRNEFYILAIVFEMRSFESPLGQ